MPQAVAFFFVVVLLEQVHDCERWPSVTAIRPVQMTVWVIDDVAGGRLGGPGGFQSAAPYTCGRRHRWRREGARLKVDGMTRLSRGRRS